MQDILAKHRLPALLSWLVACSCPAPSQSRPASGASVSELYAQAQIEEAAQERYLARARRSSAPKTSAAAICAAADRLCMIAARTAERDLGLRCQRAKVRCQAFPGAGPSDSEVALP